MDPLKWAQLGESKSLLEMEGQTRNGAIVLEWGINGFTLIFLTLFIMYVLPINAISNL